jgi:hypothetical protein
MVQVKSFICSNLSGDDVAEENCGEGWLVLEESFKIFWRDLSEGIVGWRKDGEGTL